MIESTVWTQTMRKMLPAITTILLLLSTTASLTTQSQSGIGQASNARNVAETGSRTISSESDLITLSSDLPHSDLHDLPPEEQQPDRAEYHMYTSSSSKPSQTYPTHTYSPTADQHDTHTSSSSQAQEHDATANDDPTEPNHTQEHQSPSRSQPQNSHSHHSGPAKIYLNETQILLSHQPSPLSFLAHDRQLKISNPLTGDLIPDPEPARTYPCWIIIHITSMIFAWFIFLPLAIATSNYKSFWPRAICRAGFVLFLLVGILAGLIYRSVTPDLYVGEKHSIMGYILSLIALGLSIFDFLPVWKALKSRWLGNRSSVNYHQVPDGDESLSRSSESLPLNPSQGNDKLEKDGETSLPRVSAGKKFMINLRGVADRATVVAASAAAITGVVVYTGSCRAEYINGCLAHFIKGGIFFWYGILNWTRYLGGYPEYGWPWTSDPSPKKGALSAEMVESLVVFLYGITNVWMERFGSAPDEPYTVKQVQHISIAVMFAFGGLVGIMLETPKLRLLIFRSNTGRTSNPFPSLCIAITGLAMSLHHQEYQFQVVIHTLWGALLGFFGVLRWASYALGGGERGPPVTEALGSLCLIAGGTVFMESVEQVTFTAMRYKFDDVMAFLNVTVAFVCLVMFWTMALMVVKRSGS